VAPDGSSHPIPVILRLELAELAGVTPLCVLRVLCREPSSI